MFKDLKTDNVYYNAVMFLGNAGLSVGRTDGTFKPFGFMSRAELCSWLVMLMSDNIGIYNLQKGVTVPWKDVHEHWAQDYISVFYRTIMIFNKEYGNGTGLNFAELLNAEYFYPGENVKAEDASKWVDAMFKVWFPKCYTESYFYCNSGREVRREEVADIIYNAAGMVANCFYENRTVEEFIDLWSHSGIKRQRPNVHILRANNLIQSVVTTFEEEMLESVEHLPDQYEGRTAYQYTSLHSLRKMLDQLETVTSGENEFVRLQLWLGNTAYLNDPKEGAVFDAIIQKWFPDMAEILGMGERSSLVVRTSNTYIACLTHDSKERLPMWVQYADFANGCRIEFEMAKNHEFKMVRYYDNDLSLFRGVEEYIKKNGNPALQFILLCVWKEWFSNNRFFYKDSYYEHESEIRIIKESDPMDAKKNCREGELFPRLYLETDNPLRIVSVTLGPKCENAEQIALALQSYGIKVVKRSEVQFR